MPTDHIHCPIVGELVTVSGGAYEIEREIPFWLGRNDVYVECGVIPDPATGLSVRFSVIDESGGSATTAKSVTANTEYTGSNRIHLDCSDLAKGEATLRIESKDSDQYRIYNCYVQW